MQSIVTSNPARTEWPASTDPTRAVRLFTRLATEEAGFSTAELLGNAALGIAALVAIWALLTQVGSSVIDFIRASLGV